MKTIIFKQDDFPSMTEVVAATVCLHKAYRKLNKTKE